MQFTIRVRSGLVYSVVLDLFQVFGSYFGHFEFSIFQFFDHDSRQQSRAKRYGSHVKRHVQIAELVRTTWIFEKSKKKKNEFFTSFAVAIIC